MTKEEIFESALTETKNTDLIRKYLDFKQEFHYRLLKLNETLTEVKKIK